MDDGDAPKDKSEDVLLVHGTNEARDAYRVLRKRGQSLEFGELRSSAEGRPIYGEVVKLTQRTEHSLLFDVEVVAKGHEVEPAEARGGPAQVATDTYRRNWEAIFGRGDPVN